MASNELSSGRVSPILSDLLLTSAQSNQGKYTFNKVPCTFTLDTASKFKGSFRAIPLKDQFGDGRVVGTGALKHQVGSKYYDLTRERAFDSVDYQCVHRAGLVNVWDTEEERTEDTSIAGLMMRASRATMLTAAIFDDFEYDFVTAAFNTSSFSNADATALTGGGGVKWSGAGSSPAKDGIAVKAIMRLRGAKVDCAFLSYDVALALCSHPETLGVWYKTSGATNAPPSVDMETMLGVWARTWGLKYGVHVVESLYNSANPASTAALTEFVSDKVAFHCLDGLHNSYQVSDTITANGLVSLAVIREKDYTGKEDRLINPHGTQLVGLHAFDIVTPYASAAYRPAYVITDVI